ncbi:MAG TPA: hypothetical protein VE620_14205 [Myxococcales bacterium]|jgi:hypothetical protein|nr:hypothetical protein [Myxococcales bacterium]
MKTFVVRAVAALAVLGATAALAQQKQKISYKVQSSVTSYTQQHVIDVGDVPGHQIRVYEIRYSYAAEGPVFDGVKVTEAWSRAASDYVDGTGNASGYSVYNMQNGEKVFARFALVAQSTIGSDGAKKTTFSTVTTLTGGTGRFRGIHGTLKTTGATDFKSGPSSQTEGEYWLDNTMVQADKR